MITELTEKELSKKIKFWSESGYETGILGYPMERPVQRGLAMHQRLAIRAAYAEAYLKGKEAREKT